MAAPRPGHPRPHRRLQRGRRPGHAGAARLAGRPAPHRACRGGRPSSNPRTSIPISMHAGRRPACLRPRHARASARRPARLLAPRVPRLHGAQAGQHVPRDGPDCSTTPTCWRGCSSSTLERPARRQGSGPQVAGGTVPPARAAGIDRPRTGRRPSRSIGIARGPDRVHERVRARRGDGRGRARLERRCDGARRLPGGRRPPRLRAPAPEARGARRLGRRCAGRLRTRGCPTRRRSACSAGTIRRFTAGSGPPGGTFADDLDEMCGWVTHLDGSCVAIQGPPGTGKTYRGAHLVHSARRRGPAGRHHRHEPPRHRQPARGDRPGVRREGRSLRAARRSAKCRPARTEACPASPTPPATAHCAKTDFNLVAGTTWLFAGPDMREAPVDVLDRRRGRPARPGRCARRVHRRDEPRPAR